MSIAVDIPDGFDATELIINEVHDDEPKDQSERSEAAAGSAGGPAGGGQVAGEPLQVDGRGRPYFRLNGKTVYVRKGETPEDARARALGGGDPRPGRAPRAAPKAPRPAAPKDFDLKGLEAELAEALESPAVVCAMFGDTWGADHFTRQGPVLARNLVAAAEKNPWLRRKLEDYSHGGEGALKLIAMLGVTGALIGYAIPPAIYYLNLPAPEMARTMYGIPARRVREPEDLYGPDEAETPYSEAA